MHDLLIKPYLMLPRRVSVEEALDVVTIGHKLEAYQASRNLAIHLQYVIYVSIRAWFSSLLLTYSRS